MVPPSNSGTGGTICVYTDQATDLLST